MVMLMSNKYQKVGLFDHNVTSYEIIKESFDKGKDVVGIVHLLERENHIMLFN